MNFWLRSPGGGKIYHLELKNIFLPPAAKKIYFYFIEENMVATPGRKGLGNYRLEYKTKILKKLSYSKFLKLLKKLA